MIKKLLIFVLLSFSAIPTFATQEKNIRVIFAGRSVGRDLTLNYFDPRGSRSLWDVLDTLQVSKFGFHANFTFRFLNLNAIVGDIQVSDTIEGTGGSSISYVTTGHYGGMKFWSASATGGTGWGLHALFRDTAQNILPEETLATNHLFRRPKYTIGGQPFYEKYDLVIIKQPYTNIPAFAALTPAERATLVLDWKDSARTLMDHIANHPYTNFAFVPNSPLCLQEDGGQDFLGDTLPAKEYFEFLNWWDDTLYKRHDNFGKYSNFWYFDIYTNLIELGDSANKYCLKNAYWGGPTNQSHLSALGYAVAQDTIIKFIKEATEDILIKNAISHTIGTFAGGTENPDTTIDSSKATFDSLGIRGFSTTSSKNGNLQWPYMWRHGYTSEDQFHGPYLSWTDFTAAESADERVSAYLQNHGYVSHGDGTYLHHKYPMPIERQDISGVDTTYVLIARSVGMSNATTDSARQMARTWGSRYVVDGRWMTNLTLGAAFGRALADTAFPGIIAEINGAGSGYYNRIFLDNHNFDHFRRGQGYYTDNEFVLTFRNKILPSKMFYWHPTAGAVERTDGSFVWDTVGVNDWFYFAVDSGEHFPTLDSVQMYNEIMIIDSSGYYVNGATGEPTLERYDDGGFKPITLFNHPYHKGMLFAANPTTTDKFSMLTWVPLPIDSFTKVDINTVVAEISDAGNQRYWFRVKAGGVSTQKGGALKTAATPKSINFHFNGFEDITGLPLAIKGSQYAGGTIVGNLLSGGYFPPFDSAFFYSSMRASIELTRFADSFAYWPDGQKKQVFVNGTAFLEDSVAFRLGKAAHIYNAENDGSLFGSSSGTLQRWNTYDVWKWEDSLGRNNRIGYKEGQINWHMNGTFVEANYAARHDTTEQLMYRFMHSLAARADANIIVSLRSIEDGNYRFQPKLDNWMWRPFELFRPRDLEPVGGRYDSGKGRYVSGYEVAPIKLTYNLPSGSTDDVYLRKYIQGVGRQSDIDTLYIYTRVSEQNADNVVDSDITITFPNNRLGQYLVPNRTKVESLSSPVTLYSIAAGTAVGVIMSADTGVVINPPVSVGGDSLHNDFSVENDSVIVLGSSGAQTITGTFQINWSTSGYPDSAGANKLTWTYAQSTNFRDTIIVNGTETYNVYFSSWIFDVDSNWSLRTQGIKQFKLPVACVRTITAPTSITSWNEGASQNITWTSNGDCGGTIAIELWKNSIFVGIITASTANDGVHSWTVNDFDAGVGSNYQIKINDNETFDEDYSDNFTIVPSSPPTPIKKKIGGRTKGGGNTRLK